MLISFGSMGSRHGVGIGRREHPKMPKVTLTTKKAVDDIPHPDRGQTIHWDSGLTGFGVLAGTRQKTFILERRVNRKPRRVTIGKVGEITLQKARQDAEQLIGEMAG